MSENCLENFLNNIHPYLEGDSFDKFLSELKKVPDYQNVFRTLLEENPAWLKQAQTSANGVSFFYDEVYTTSSIPLPNKLDLRTFDCGQEPTIKVTKFKWLDL